MKALLAIVITISLSAACYIVSALIYFDLSWVLVAASSIWAAWDSKRIGFYRYKSELSVKPLVLFCCCYLFWILAFPCYLWLRFKVVGGSARLKDEGFSDLEQSPVKTCFRRLPNVIRKICDWLLIGLAGVKILFLLFCLEECWRGQRMWENYKHELAVKGENLDWNAMIPPSVPDSQNFYSAPMMSAWFIQPSGDIKITDDISKRLEYPVNSPEFTIAEIVFVPTGAQSNPKNAETTLRLNDPESRDKALDLVKGAIGPNFFRADGTGIFVPNPLNLYQIRPLQIRLEADKKPDVRDLIALFSGGNATSHSFLFRPDGSNSWRAVTSFFSAPDYLRWSDQFESDLDLIRDATKRPYARMDGDYRFPPAMPIPNFVNVRAVSQTLAKRAQCYLLLGQPDKALQELTLLNNLRRTLEGAPTGKPMPLVSAMINVAIVGLYVDTIGDGLRTHAWREPQLITLQEQLEGINLATVVKESFHEEAASSARLIDILMRDSQVRHELNANLWQKIKNLKRPDIMRGFLYFNELTAVRLDQMMFDSVDISGKTISVSKTIEFQHEEDRLDHIHFWQKPYTLIAEIAVPNFTKALQTFAFNQTKADEAQVVCALERYRIERGNYPQSLDHLVPKFIGKLPRDIISGQPLKYRRIADDQFLLYSVGWNEIDNGGQVSSAFDQGDWVWQQ